MITTNKFIFFIFLSLAVLLITSINAQPEPTKRTCTASEALTCAGRAGLPLADVGCLLSNPETCTDAICLADEWLLALSCADQAGCSIGEYLDASNCASTFQMCSQSVISAICVGALTPDATPVPLPPLEPLPANNTGVDLSELVPGTSGRPARLKFGNVGDKDVMRTGCHELGGLEIAFNEVNANGGARGTRLELVFKHSSDNQPAGKEGVPAGYNDILVQDNVFAFAQTSLIAPFVYTWVAQPYQIPMINPQLGNIENTVAFNDPNVITIHGELNQLIFHFLKLAVHGPGMCTRLGIVAENFIEIEQLIDTMDRLAIEAGFAQYEPGKAVKRLLLPQQTPSTLAAMTEWTNPLFENNFIPNCIVVLKDQDWIPAIRRHKNFDPTGRIFMTDISIDNATLFIDPVEGHADWFVDHVTFMHIFPQPTRRDSMLATRYREALKTHVYTHNQTSCTHEPQIQQFESYVAGLFIAEVVANMREPFSRQEFVNTVYRKGLFTIDDLYLGIFANNRCNGYTTDDIVECNCTTGGRQIFTGKVNSNGILDIYYDDKTRGEFGVSSLAIPIHKCMNTSVEESIPKATYFATLVPLQPIDASTAFVASLNEFQIAYNNESHSRQRKHRVYAVPAQYNSTSTTAVAAAERVKTRYIPAVFLGGNSHVGDSLHVEVTASSVDAALPVEYNEPFSSHRITFLPRLQDYVHALAQFIDHEGKGDSVEVIGETEQLAMFGRRSVETFGHNTRSVDVFSDAQLKPFGDNNILLVAQSVSMVSKAIEMSGAGTLLIAAVEEQILEALKVHNSTKSKNIVFATPFENFWSGATALSQIVATLTSTTPTPAKMRSALSLHFITAAASEGAVRQDALEDWIYSPGFRNVKGVALGPHSRDPCNSSSSTLCECANSIRQFFIHPLSEWSETVNGGNTKSPSDPLFTHTRASCEVEYQSLPSGFTLSGENIATIATSFVAVFSGCVALFVVSRQRNTANAPKDETKPFAMVFTDIQSSTNLWANAPAEMTEGVEAHHAILRSVLKLFKGYEVKTIGDSFMVAFTTPLSATRFALSVQTALLNHDWGTRAFDELYNEKILSQVEDDKSAGNTENVSDEYVEGQTSSTYWNGIRVRVGVHFGTGSIQKDEVTRGYDYYGTVVNTAARVESVGNGGQVLLTEAAYQEVFGEAPPTDLADVEAVDLGPQPLRGLPAPVRLFQCTAGPLKGRTYPPLRVEKDETENPDLAGEGESDFELSGSVSKNAVTSFKKSHSAAWGSDDDGGSTPPTSDDDGFTSGVLMARIIRRHWDCTDSHEQVRARLNDGLSFVFGVLATSRKTYRAKFMQHIAEKWHIDLDVLGGSRFRPDKISGRRHEEAVLLHVLVRVLKGIETRERREGTSNRFGAAPQAALESPKNGPTYQHQHQQQQEQTLATVVSQGSLLAENSGVSSISIVPSNT